MGTYPKYDVCHKRWPVCICKGVVLKVMFWIRAKILSTSYVAIMLNLSLLMSWNARNLKIPANLEIDMTRGRLSSFSQGHTKSWLIRKHNTLGISFSNSYHNRNDLDCFTIEKWDICYTITGWVLLQKETWWDLLLW